MCHYLKKILYFVIMCCCLGGKLQQTSLAQTLAAEEQQAAIRLEAENFRAMRGMEVAESNDGSSQLGWIDQGDWLEFEPVTLPQYTSFYFDIRVATASASGRFNLLVDGKLVQTIKVSNTGAWVFWQTQRHELDLVAGSRQIRIEVLQGAWNLNWVEIKPIAATSVAQDSIRIEAEDYQAMSGVVVDDCNEGGKLIGYLDPGDWVEYGNITIAETASYAMNFRVASAMSSGRIRVRINSDTNFERTIPHTGSWLNWQTISEKVFLSKGVHRIRIEVTGAAWNLNWFELSPLLSQHPVALHGAIKTQGARLVDKYNQAIQLRGLSSHGLQWFGHLISSETISWLRDDWNLNVFRAAMYTKEGGYIDNPSIKVKLIEIIEAAIKHDVYVIVDWHILSDGNPQTYKQQAKEFFTEIAQRFGKYPHVIYEIANEPNGAGVTWNEVVKPYAEELINTIRQYDPDNLIIVGTPNYDLQIMDAALNPIQANNIAYACHFYAGGTDGNWLRTEIDRVRARGLTIFISEWGTSYYTGNDGIYLESARTWLDYLNRNKISWVNFSLSNKDETSAALKPTTLNTYGWTQEQLSLSGSFVRSAMRE